MKIGLALSGGGFRATLFHLGVVRYLHEADLLKHVSVVASSSGGSVIAALLALRVAQLRDAKDFNTDIARPLIRIARLGLRERIVRRIPWLWLFRTLSRPVREGFRRLVPRSATELLASYYDHALYGRATMDDLGRASDSLQTLILATNVSRGGITTFGERAIGFLPPNLDEVAEPVEAGLLRISKAVAASSAFPAIFPPIELSHADVGADEAAFRNQWFTDAGVSDNLAFDSLVRTRKDLDLLLVSDAGRSNLPLREQSLGLLTNALRSSDLMLFRISELARERARTYQGPRVALLSISETTQEVPGQSPEVVQRTLERLRTDFDRFSMLEIDELIRHGWCVARQNLKEVSGVPPTEAPTVMKKRRGSPSKIARRLEQGAFRRTKLLNADDWISWIYGIIALALLLGVTSVTPYLYATSKNYINLIRAGRLLTPDVPQWSNTPVPAIAFVDALPPDANPEFDLISEDRVWDLRPLRPEASGNAVLMKGPSYLLRSATVSPRSENEGTYRFRFLTSGNDFKAWRVGGDAITIFGQRTMQSSGSSVLQPFVVETEVRQGANLREPLQVQAQVVDAFKERNNWWAGMRVTSKVARISMRIVFPKEYPFKKGTTRFVKYPNETPLSAQSFDGIVLDKDESELLWYVEHPTEGFTYRVNWDW